MMTQGWRRFSWKNVLTDAKVKHNFLPEPGLNISGKVRKYNKKPLENSIQINGSYASGESKSLILSETEKNGDFFIQNMDFNDTAIVFLQASVGTKDKIYDIAINEPILEKNKTQTFLYKQIFNQENKKYLESAKEAIKLEEGMKLLNLEQVNVTAKREKKADFRRPYGDKVTKSVDYKDYSPPAGTTVLESIQGKVPGVTVKCFGLECSVKIRGNVSLQGNNEAILLLDGFPVDASSIQSIPITEVESIDVISGAAASLYGSRGATGLINVLTKRSNPNFDVRKSYKSEGTYLFKKEGYVPTKEFYVPKYEVNTKSTIDDSRTTIFWSPNIEVINGKAKVSFFNSAEKTNVNVNIQGKNENGALGVRKFTYRVE
jgi:hypothetical protein